MQVTPTDAGSMREAAAAYDLVQAATRALHKAVSKDGAMAGCVERAERTSRSLVVEQGPERFVTSLEATHQAVADVLAIGRSIRGHLDPPALDALDSLAGAQRILYGLANTFGARTPEPLAVVAPDGEGDRPVIEWAEKRASPRVELNIEVGLESESNFFEGFSEDLSDGGLFVATYDLRPMGSVIDLEFTLPTGHLIRARAEVCWVRQLRQESTEGISPGMGLRFVDLLEEDMAAIRAFIQHRSPMFFPD